MVMIYRLTPIDPTHESWRRSSVTGQYLRLWAHDWIGKLAGMRK